MTKPKRIDLSQQELDALIERVEAGTLLESDREIIKAMADTISILSNAVDEKTASIKRLLKLIFGSRTERTASVLKNNDKKKNDPTAKFLHWLWWLMSRDLPNTATYIPAIRPRAKP